MGRFHTFDHTADIGIHIEAPSLDDLFATAARALVALVVANPDSIQASSARTLTLEADDLTDLMVAWLSEVLFLIETSHEVFARCEVSVDPKRARLQGTLHGERIDPARHILDHELKAVTRHGAWIRESAGRFEAEVIVDV